MVCRVGMTTDLVARKAYWESQYPNLHGWVVLGTYNSKSDAQRAETYFAQEGGCVSHPGGDGLEFATWHVYKFQY